MIDCSEPQPYVYWNLSLYHIKYLNIWNINQLITWHTDKKADKCKIMQDMSRFIQIREQFCWSLPNWSKNLIFLNIKGKEKWLTAYVDVVQ